jgi:hypothetical protein
MKRRLLLGTTLLCCLVADAWNARAGNPPHLNGWGVTTPTSITFQYDSVSVITVDGGSGVISDKPFSATFKRGDADFASIPLTDVVLPEGRYAGVALGVSFTLTTELDGVTYEGRDVDMANAPLPITSGSKIYTTGADGTADGAIVTSPPAGGATTVAAAPQGQTTGDTRSFFGSPVCVASDPSSQCQSGDTVILAHPSAGQTQPRINLVVDLFHAVTIDPKYGAIVVGGMNYGGKPTLGDPGAAIHLTATSGTGIDKQVADISLVFDANKKLIDARSQGLAGNMMPGFCGGNANVKVTAVPPGFDLTPAGAPMVMSIDATGKVQFAAGAGQESASSGMLTIANVLLQVGQTTTVTCAADASADPPYLGFTYAGGSGAPGSSTFTIARIIDPRGILGTCDSGKAGFAAASAGTCASNGGDGYP